MRYKIEIVLDRLANKAGLRSSDVISFFYYFINVMISARECCQVQKPIESKQEMAKYGLYQ